MVNLCHRDIETLAEPIFEALDDVTLLLERMRMLDVYVEREDANSRHESKPPIGREAKLLQNQRFGRYSLHGKRFEDIADLDVIEVD